MKKAAIILITVAILGLLGSYARGHESSGGNQVSVRSSTTSNTATTPSSASSSSVTASYKDGTYTGASEFTPYGTVQIAVVVSGGKITDVDFLQMPNDMGHSREITSSAEPLLKQVTLQSQSANIDFVSGATSTSEGYQQSLQAALDQAAQTSSSAIQATGQAG
jgi:uncharacterized protein with FMN-binding domain